MRLLIVFATFAIAVYVAAYFITHDLWIMVHAAGIVMLIYLVILIFRSTKPPVSTKLRLLVSVFALVLIAGIATAWIEMSIMTRWQKRALVTIRAVIGHGVIQDTLSKRALRTMEAYHSPNRLPQETFTQVFNRLNPPLVPGSNILDSLFPNPSVRTICGGIVFAVSPSDTEVVLIGEDQIAFGLDSLFQNFDGKKGKSQARLNLTSKGVTYELEN